MKKSNQEIIDFVNNGVVYLKTLENGDKKNKETKSKFQYAVEKTLKKTQKNIDKYNEDLEDLKIEHCATDENGTILYDNVGGQRDYAFTKDGKRAFNKALKTLLKKEQQIEPHFCKEIPENLSEFIQEKFVGFVIEEAEEKKD